MSRFNYVKFDPAHIRMCEGAKIRCQSLEDYLNSNLKDSRAKSLAITKLEEFYMWVGKAIRDDQIACGGDATHIAERTNV